VTQRDSGSVLDGKYEILERLATGGMGEVWRARHIHLHELRVIKILRADRATDPHALQRFAQEARIATQIKHPNVAILYDFARLEDGSFYMVWEHIEGEDVGSWLRSKGPFPIPLAVELGIQTLRGLDAIHSAGVIHRDLSPDNIMLSRDRRHRPHVKIIDLGLAKNLQTPGNLEITQAGVFMGKLMYCSPEQAGAIQDEPLDHRSDLYSFACVLYEMVCGRPPFDSENPHGYVLKRLSEPPLPLAGRNPEIKVPPALDEVVLRGLAKDRDRRWPDALSFLQGLVRVAEQLRGVSTQEVQVARAATPTPAVGPRPAATPAPPPAATAAPRQPASRAPASELSREERVELLAQIERAAKRVNEASRLQELALQAIGAGRLADAAQHLAQLEAMSPRHAGIPELRTRLVTAGWTAPAAPPAAPSPAAAAPRRAAPSAVPPAAAATPAAVVPESAPAPARASAPVPASAPAPAPAVAPAPAPAKAPAPAPAARPPAPASDQDAQRARVAEAEKLLEKYLREHKQSLAQFALDTLLELMPAHPRRADYETWVGMMGEEAEQLRRAGAAVEEGRRELTRGDLAAARARLEEVERLDPAHRVADAFRREVEEAAARDRVEADLDRRRDRLEQLLEGKRLAEAEKELERLSSSGLARVSVENYRLRIADIAALAERESRTQEFERQYRERVQKHDWMGAREVAQALSEAVPGSPRPAALHAEIARLEEIHRKQQGIEQGVRQLETFLDQGRTAEAEMALKILVQMAPDHPQRYNFEQRVKALRPGRR
jgi:tRNA A-37 threonylcarbamoyl transferase component Bud32